MGLFYRRGDGSGEALDLDEITAQRLLDGLTPDDAPPGYAGVAALLAAAAAPATDEELAGEDDARATFVATSAAAAQAAPARPFRAVAALVAALLAIGGTAVVAGATGHLPGPAQDSIDNVLDGIGVTDVDGDGAPTGSPGTEERGADPTGAAGHGLCTAYAAGQGAENGGKLNSTAFRALLAIVGEDAIVEFCAAVEPGNPAVPGPAGTPPGQGGTPPGQVDNPGQGGTPPGQGGTPPGQGGTPPGQVDNPGQGGTPPGQGGIPPGQGGTPPGQGGNSNGGGNGNGNGDGGGNGQGNVDDGNGNGGGQTLGLPDPVGGLLDGLGMALDAS